MQVVAVHPDIYDFLMEQLSASSPNITLIRDAGYSFDGGSFYTAISEGEVDLVGAFLAENISYDTTYITPLVAAARKGNIKMIKALLEGGFDPNQTVIEDVYYPLYVIARKKELRFLEVAKVLIAAGADPLLPIKMDEIRTAYHRAKSNSPEMFSLFKESRGQTR